MAEAKKAGKSVITKDMPIGKIVTEHPECMEVFMKYGMHCIGCAAAHFENLEQGCSAHGIDADKMVSDLNKCVEKAGKAKKKPKK
jgi:hybrid cluster-associated redox disulfide protein